jgi:hypothetical protein
MFILEVDGVAAKIEETILIPHLRAVKVRYS